MNKKQLLINQTLNECRVALVENEEILDFLIDRHSNRRYDVPKVGDIFKGKVLRVLPGMQSAFVDIGFARAAFLYVDDAYLPTLEEQKTMAEKLRHQQAQQLSKARGEIIPDEMSTLSETVDMKFRPDLSISEFLKEGDEIMVQVAKEPISTKGPRITRHVTIPGRYIVFMPFLEHIGVSRRIEDEAERDRLKEILESLRPDGMGVIARTVAELQTAKTLRNDFNMLVKIWKEVQKKYETSNPCEAIHTDLSFVQRIMRDIIDDNVDEVVVDTKANFKEVEKFSAKYVPQLKGKIRMHQDPIPLFESHGIDLEIGRALGNKVFLKSGGSINIDQTEALVSIDINTGKYVGRKTLEDTILQTNLEAVKEIAYQLRLRNCGGIIIIDFIDMEKEEHRDMVYQKLLEALKKDRAKTNVLPISGLGLVEMTRKRTRDTLVRVMTDPCSYCEGVGRVKTPLTVCYEIIREASKVMAKTQGSKVSIFAHPEVTARLCEEDIDIIETLEEAHGKTLIIRSENGYHIEQYEIFPHEI